ncbi:MAG TPA: topoisomerase C-terminal repeat-containing protein [Casimicrobiaceae bacterium]|nr:topoisomerase C-terminal repeat-containing protein [Casimicrobiaceae bacterium]
MRVVGAHPADGAPVELHAGRYGPYVKHGGVNATVPNRDDLDKLTLDEAVALLVAKGGKPAKARKTPARAAKAAPAEPPAPAAAKRTSRASPAAPRAATAKKATVRKTAKTPKTSGKAAMGQATGTAAPKTAALKRAPAAARKR